MLVDGSPAYLSTHTTRGKKKAQQPSASTNEANALAYFAQQFKELDAVKVPFTLHTFSNLGITVLGRYYR